MSDDNIRWGKMIEGAGAVSHSRTMPQPSPYDVDPSESLTPTSGIPTLAGHKGPRK